MAFNDRYRKSVLLQFRDANTQKEYEVFRINSKFRHDILAVVSLFPMWYATKESIYRYEIYGIFHCAIQLTGFLLMAITILYIFLNSDRFLPHLSETIDVHWWRVTLGDFLVLILPHMFMLFFLAQILQGSCAQKDESYRAASEYWYLFCLEPNQTGFPPLFATVMVYFCLYFGLIKTSSWRIYVYSWVMGLGWIVLIHMLLVFRHNEPNGIYLVLLTYPLLLVTFWICENSFMEKFIRMSDEGDRPPEVTTDISEEAATNFHLNNEVDLILGNELGLLRSNPHESVPSRMAGQPGLRSFTALSQIPPNVSRFYDTSDSVSDLSSEN